MTWDDLVEKAIAYFEEHIDEWNPLADGADLIDPDDRHEPMEYINEIYSEPLEAITRAFYGYDADSSGEDNYAPFNPNRDYFYFNGYGNLVSTDETADYSDSLDESGISELYENREYYDLPRYIEKLFDAYADEVEEDEEE